MILIFIKEFYFNADMYIKESFLKNNTGCVTGKKRSDLVFCMSLGIFKNTYTLSVWFLDNIRHHCRLLNLTKTTPWSFIERYCSKLNINHELTNLCKFIACKIEKNKLIPENTPHSIAGGIIYFVCQICNLNISKTTINGISKISEVTINKCYKKLELHKNILIPDAIQKKYSE